MLGFLAQNVGVGKERDQGRGEKYKRRKQQGSPDKQDLFDTLVWPGYAYRIPHQTICRQRLNN